MKHAYTSNYFIETRTSGRGARTVYDLNVACSESFYNYPLRSGLRSEDYHAIKESDYSGSLASLAMSLVKHVNSYAINGRKTVMRSIFGFLSFQAKKNLVIGEREGLEEWCLEIKRLVFSNGIKEKTAKYHLVQVNKFLKSRGRLKRNFSFTFSNATKSADSNMVYTTDEFNTVIYLLHIIYEVFEISLNEHCEAIEKGIRPGSCLFTNSSTNIFKETEVIVNGKTYKYEMVIFSPIRTFNLVSFYLFTYYTCAPKNQSINLSIYDVIKQESGQIVTDYQFKGRAFKFVRFGIGKSTIETDRVGVKWFNGFLNVKHRYLKCLKSLEIECTEDALFHSLEESAGQKGFIPLNVVSETLYSNHLWWKLYEDGFEIPRFNLRAIRKMAEQLIDRKGKNPFLTISKSQHEWETYKKNYSSGNKTESLRIMSSALKILVEGGVADLSFNDRQRIANDHKFNLVSDTDTNYITTATGLGCMQDAPRTYQEKSFFREQQSKGREPKVCANILECIDCAKCGIIDSEENYYELLSFREAIRLNKATYTGSDAAQGSYERIINTLDERLCLADQSKLAKAKKRLNKNGVSEVWKITI